MRCDVRWREGVKISMGCIYRGVDGRLGADARGVEQWSSQSCVENSHWGIEIRISPQRQCCSDRWLLVSQSGELLLQGALFSSLMVPASYSQYYQLLPIANRRYCTSIPWPGTRSMVLVTLNMRITAQHHLQDRSTLSTQVSVFLFLNCLWFKWIQLEKSKISDNPNSLAFTTIEVEQVLTASSY